MNRTSDRIIGMPAERTGVVVTAAIVTIVLVIAGGCATGRRGVVATGTIEVTTGVAGVLSIDGSPVADLSARETYIEQVEWGQVRLQMQFGDGSRESRTVEVPAFETVRVTFGGLVRGDAGGIVFYDKGEHTDGWRYLEAWIADEEGAYQWKNNRTSTAGTSTAVGSGYYNTYTAMGRSDHPAADVVRTAEHGGYNDWFLPSKDELNLMYENLYLKNIGDFSPEPYWTSSESEANPALAWGQGFFTGDQLSNYKFVGNRVRAVRAF